MSHLILGLAFLDDTHDFPRLSEVADLFHSRIIRQPDEAVISLVVFHPA